tara:strand:+ start:363 stop:500 length:138 start_codon:yes stop_codon:yes gene_type:complete
MVVLEVEVLEPLEEPLGLDLLIVVMGEEVLEPLEELMEEPIRVVY